MFQKFLLYEEYKAEINLESDVSKKCIETQLDNSTEKTIKLLNGNKVPSIKNSDDHPTKSGHSLVLDKVVAKWDSDSSEPTLDKITLSVHKGNLLAIIGPVGAGKVNFKVLCKHFPDIKVVHECLIRCTIMTIRSNFIFIYSPLQSSVLQAILRELPVCGGSVKVNGKVSYSSQDAWVFASTVRQNILFGSPYEKKRYDKVIVLKFIVFSFGTVVCFV